MSRWIQEAVKRPGRAARLALTLRRLRGEA